MKCGGSWNRIEAVTMCMNGKCGRCGAACKAPEPKMGVDEADP